MPGMPSSSSTSRCALARMSLHRAAPTIAPVLRTLLAVAALAQQHVNGTAVPFNLTYVVHTASAITHFLPMQHMPTCHPSMRDRPSGTCSPLLMQNGGSTTNECARSPRSGLRSCSQHRSRSAQHLHVPDATPSSRARASRRTRSSAATRTARWTTSRPLCAGWTRSASHQRPCSSGPRTARTTRSSHSTRRTRATV